MSSKQAVFLWVGLILGLSLTLLIRTQEQHVRALAHSRVTVEDGVMQLIALNEEIDHLRAEIDRFEQIENEFRLAAEIQTHLASAGHLPVRGPGIVVTLKERHDNASSHIAIQDVILIMNELRAGGAEAIAVNGLRMTPALRVERTSVHGLTINGIPAGSTVRIEAIGDPQLLKASISMRGGPLAQAAIWLDTDLFEAKDLVVPAVTRHR